MTGPHLIRDIDSCRLDEGQCGLWWLGQHGFALKLGGTVLYVDAFLSDAPGRRVPPLLQPSQVTNARLVLGSHDHGDHIDRPAWPALAAASPGAAFVVPLLLRERIARELQLPPQRVLGVDEDWPVEIDGIRVSALPAAHEFLDVDAATGLHPYVGFVIEGGDFCLSHAGDTCPYEGLHERLRRWRLDLMLLPINGRDARRLRANCIGNMTCQEAADLAGALRPGAVIPTHYDMFAMNSGDVNEFVEYVRIKYPRQRVLAPSRGEGVILSRLPGKVSQCRRKR